MAETDPKKHAGKQALGPQNDQFQVGQQGVWVVCRDGRTQCIPSLGDAERGRVGARGTRSGRRTTLFYLCNKRRGKDVPQLLIGAPSPTTLSVSRLNLFYIAIVLQPDRAPAEVRSKVEDSDGSSTTRLLARLQTTRGAADRADPHLARRTHRFRGGL